MRFGDVYNPTDSEKESWAEFINEVAGFRGTYDGRGIHRLRARLDRLRVEAELVERMAALDDSALDQSSMDVEELKAIIKRLGGKVAVGRLLHVLPASVRHWVSGQAEPRGRKLGYLRYLDGLTKSKER